MTLWLRKSTVEERFKWALGEEITNCEVIHKGDRVRIEITCSANMVSLERTSLSPIEEYLGALRTTNPELQIKCSGRGLMFAVEADASAFPEEEEDTITRRM